MRKVKIIWILLLSIIFIEKIGAIDIYSNNGVLYNMNENKILFSKNSQEKVSIASLTKIMTAIVAIENIDDLNQEITISEQAFIGLDGYAKAGFKIGQTVTYEDLLYGLLLPSGAECANALALSISGNIEDFVKLMNEKAQELGLENTRFSNPIGMDDINNYSTVEEVAQILKYALKNEEFYKIFITKEYTTTTGIKLEATIKERAQENQLDASKILGSKTGFTDSAGYCLASIASINNVNYLLVTTNANTNMPYQVLDAINVYNYYSENYSYKKILSYNQYLASIEIKRSKQKEYKIYSNNDKYLYLSNEINVNDLTYEYDGIKTITKDIEKNEYLGKIDIKNKNEIIFTYDVYLEEDIKYYNYPLIIVTLFTILIITIIIIKKIKKGDK